MWILFKVIEDIHDLELQFYKVQPYPDPGFLETCIKCINAAIHMQFSEWRGQHSAEIKSCCWAESNQSQAIPNSRLTSVLVTTESARRIRRCGAARYGSYGRHSDTVFGGQGRVGASLQFGATQLATADHHGLCTQEHRPVTQTTIWWFCILINGYTALIRIT